MANKKSKSYLGGSTVITVRPTIEKQLRASDINALKVEMKARYGHMTLEQFCKEFPKRCPNLCPDKATVKKMYDYIFA